MGIVSELIINRTTDFSKRENRKYVSEALKNIEIINKVDKNNLDHKFNIDELRSRIRKHECHKCKDLHEHLRWAEKKDKLQKSVLSLELAYNTSVMSLSNKCDEILRLLTEIDYIDIKDDQVILQNKKDLVIFEKKIWEKRSGNHFPYRKQDSSIVYTSSDFDRFHPGVFHHGGEFDRLLHSWISLH